MMGKKLWRPLVFSPSVLAPFVITACTDKGEVSEQRAIEHVDALTKLADKDVQEVKRGLPRGAVAIASAWSSHADGSDTRPSVCGKLESIRNADTDLMVAKSTFFALADAAGVVLCSDQEPDILAGKLLPSAFPDLRKVSAGEAVEVTGTMAEIAFKPAASDREWLCAAPVRDSVGAVRGMYVSGWSYRRFAYHLEETLKHDLVVQAIQGKKEKVKQPLVYAFVFAGSKAYGAPVTPQVNAEVLEKIDLSAKTASGTHHQQIEISGRHYGLAAARAPSLGPDTGVAVLRSEI